MRVYIIIKIAKPLTQLLKDC